MFATLPELARRFRSTRSQQIIAHTFESQHLLSGVEIGATKVFLSLPHLFAIRWSIVIGCSSPLLHLSALLVHSNMVLVSPDIRLIGCLSCVLCVQQAMAWVRGEVKVIYSGASSSLSLLPSLFNLSLYSCHTRNLICYLASDVFVQAITLMTAIITLEHNPQTTPQQV